VRSWIADARSRLAHLPSVPARAAFESLCNFVITRTG
jgi:heptaprenyl diphosphate synthase